MKKFVLLTLMLALCSFAGAQRLPQNVNPSHYQLTFGPDLKAATFTGDEVIDVRFTAPSNKVTMNSAEIKIQDATISSGAQSQAATVEYDEKTEQVTLTTAKPIPAGPAKIAIKYTGILNDQLRGFYLSKSKTRSYATTQFENTDARRAFPSFDEPAFKATFDITLIVDKGDTAFSNGRQLSDTPGPGPDKHTVKFATTAKMSSYLAALVVGNFEYIEGEADGIPIRIYSTPGKKEMGRFVLGASEQIVSYFDKYFGIKYPYGKLDLIGLPDFSAGAMENAGLITFREVILLIDEQHGSPGLKKTIASVTSHEIAHMWFGDLVTMKWWDDVWLNEGFATWAASKPLLGWKPEWNFDLDDVSQNTNTLNTDSLANTRPIHQAAETPAQIQELFDGIAYGKAAAVLNMLEAYLGPETFRAGVREYVKQHSYGNATADDFWTTLAKVSKRPVDQIMPTWVKQAGVPIVNVKAQCSGNSTSLTLSQQRYYYDRAKFEAGNDQLWQIPVCLRASSTNSAKCELLTKKEQTFILPGCSTWVLANANAAGYYRAGYQAEAVRAMAKDAEGKFSPAERITLEADIWASVRVGRDSVGDYLAFAQGLQPDRTRAVMQSVLGRFNYIGQYLVNENDRDSYRAWLRQYLTPIAKDIGWEPKPGESDEQKTLRAGLLNALGYDARDSETLVQARKIAERALNDPTAVDQDLATGAIGLAALNGDQAFYDRIMAELKNPKSPELYYMYFYTLPQFSDQKLLQKTLDYADLRGEGSTPVPLPPPRMAITV